MSNKYIPEKAIYYLASSPIELCNTYNKKLEKIINDMGVFLQNAEDIKASITNNIISHSSEVNNIDDDQNSLIYDVLKRTNNMINEIDNMKQYYDNRFDKLEVLLNEIKEKLVEYEIEPDYNENTL